MNEIIIAAISGGILSVFATALVTWGMVRGKINEIERRMVIREQDSDKQLELIHSLHETYVTYKHFNEVISSVRESQKELKDMMTKVLEILSER